MHDEPHLEAKPDLAREHRNQIAFARSDLVAHMPDLPLFENTAMVGFGLRRWLWISLPLELVTLLAGALIYVRAVFAKTRIGDAWLWRFVAAMAAIEFHAAFGPMPATPAAEARTALFPYGAPALLAGPVDRGRGTLNG